MVSEVAVVTGGAGAIGAAVCHRLAAAGRTVVVADLDASAASRTADALAGDGHVGIGLDVADTEAVAAAMRDVVNDLGPVGVLINVAGWDRFVPFVDTSPEFWDRVIEADGKRVVAESVARHIELLSREAD